MGSTTSDVHVAYNPAIFSSEFQALKEQPAVNAVIDGDDIVYRDYIDVSVAVSSPKGLVVPVRLRPVCAMFA